MHGTGSTDSEMLGDGDSEVGEVDILVFGYTYFMGNAVEYGIGSW